MYRNTMQHFQDLRYLLFHFFFAQKYDCSNEGIVYMSCSACALKIAQFHLVCEQRSQILMEVLM